MSVSPAAAKTPVVIITGASGALGTAISTAFAQMGSNLLLQDIQPASKALEALSQRLREQYKVAISTSYIDIRTSPEDLIKLAVKTFGYITVLINNAGFLRDVSFIKQTDEQWNDVIDIHLTVPYKLTRAAWPYFMEQKFGRILFVSSHAGLFGNRGQSNYSAAKSGILGLTKTLSIEGKKNNILVNAIAPFAASSMTKGVFPAEMLTNFNPSEVSPVALFLSHHLNTNITGEVVQCGGGFVSRTITYTPGGFVFKTGDGVSMQDKLSNIASNWATLDKLPTGITNQNVLSGIKQGVSDEDNKSTGIFAKSADPIFAEMMRLVNTYSEASKTQSTSPAEVLNTATKQTTPVQSQTPSTGSTSPPQANSNTGVTSPTGTKAKIIGTPTVLPFALKADILINGLTPHIDADILKEAGVVIGFEVMPGAPQARAKKGSAAAPAATPGSDQKRLVTIDLKNGTGAIIWDKLEGGNGKKPDAVLVIHDELLVKLFLQEVEAQSLYLTGKIKVRGDIAKAMKFEQVLLSFEHKVNVKDLLAKSQARL